MCKRRKFLQLSEGQEPWPPPPALQAPLRRSRRAAGPPLGRARRHRARPAHGRARRDHRERRAADRPAGAGLRRRAPLIRRHGVHALLRRAAAARRQDLRPDRATPGADDRADRLRPGVRARRRGADVRGPRGRPGPAGCERRVHGAGRALPDRRDLHRAARARQGVRRLRRGRQQRRRRRSAARRRAHRVRRLALVPLRQRRRGRRRDRGRPPGAAEGRRLPGPGRRRLRRAGHRWPGRAGAGRERGRRARLDLGRGAGPGARRPRADRRLPACASAGWPLRCCR